MEYKGFAINRTFKEGEYIIFEMATGKQVFQTLEGFDTAWEWVVNAAKEERK